MHGFVKTPLGPYLRAPRAHRTQKAQRTLRGIYGSQRTHMGTSDTNGPGVRDLGLGRSVDPSII
jgi:hypothetical protein